MTPSPKENNLAKADNFCNKKGNLQQNIWIFFWGVCMVLTNLHKKEKGQISTHAWYVSLY
jgi:hypothetical protein